MDSDEKWQFGLFLLCENYSQVKLLFTTNLLWNIFFTMGLISLVLLALNSTGLNRVKELESSFSFQVFICGYVPDDRGS